LLALRGNEVSEARALVDQVGPDRRHRHAQGRAKVLRPTDGLQRAAVADQALGEALKVGVADLQAANLAIRSDFKSFVGSGSSKTKKGTGNASAVAFAAKDPILQEIISKYQIAGTESRKKFARAAMTLLA